MRGDPGLSIFQAYQFGKLRGQGFLYSLKFLPEQTEALAIRYQPLKSPWFTALMASVVASIYHDTDLGKLQDSAVFLILLMNSLVTVLCRRFP